MEGEAGLMRNLGVLGVKREMVFPGWALGVKRVDNSLGGLNFCCELNMFKAEIISRTPDVDSREQVIRRGEKEKYSTIFRGDVPSDVLCCRFEGLPKRSGRSVLKWREWRTKSCWLDATAPELAEYITYCCVTRGNRETLLAGKLVAVNVCRDQ